jgi:hypothetical protein
MGWQDRSIISGHLDRANLKGAHFKRLVGWEKNGVKLTVAVDPPTIDGGETGHVDVVLAFGLEVSKWHKCVAIPPTLEPGLQLLTSTIIGPDVVRVLLVNQAISPIDGAEQPWDFYGFRRRAT